MTDDWSSQTSTRLGGQRHHDQHSGWHRRVHGPGGLARGSAPIRASDVWSLGIIIHEILVGSRPEWKGQSAPQVAVKGGNRSRASELFFAICFNGA